MQFAMDDNFKTVAKMKVIGVGGAGGNAINRMVQSGLQGVEFISINTDAMALDNNLAHVRLQIGEKITGGLGVGADPQVGNLAIEEDREKVRAHLEGADLVFITAGMGGGTGTGAAPVVAQIAREMGILTVAVVTKPFTFEGPVRERNALYGLEALRNVVDTIIVIPNQKLLSIIDRNTTFRDAFRIADEVLTSATRGISDIILKHGDIQVDFNDVKTIMRQGGDALMGSGVGRGENRAIEAADRAIHSPLLDDVSIAGATGVLVNISGGDDLGMLEVNDAMNHIYQAIGIESNPNIIFGTVITPELKDELRVTVIATGFGQVHGANKNAKTEQNTLLSYTERNTTKFETPLTSMPRLEIPERPYPRFDTSLDRTTVRSEVLSRIETPAPRPEITMSRSDTAERTTSSFEAQTQQPPQRITNRMESVERVVRMDSLDHQALRDEYLERGSRLFATDEGPETNSDHSSEMTSEKTSEKSTRKNITSSFAATEGRFREEEVDVDYETPAFLRYQGD